MLSLKSIAYAQADNYFKATGQRPTPAEFAISQADGIFQDYVDDGFGNAVLRQGPEKEESEVKKTPSQPVNRVAVHLGKVEENADVLPGVEAPPPQRSNGQDALRHSLHN